MYRRVLALALSLTLVLTFVAVPAFAQKKGDAECSPGYWKNHPEEWVGICCTAETDPTCGELLNALIAQGPGSGAVREDAAEFLDACFGSPETTPCADD